MCLQPHSLESIQAIKAMKDKKKNLSHQDSDHNHKTETNDIVKINGKDQTKALGKSRHRSCDDHGATITTVSPAQVIKLHNWKSH